MRSVIISVILFTAVIALMIFNVFYVNQTINTMKAVAGDVCDGKKSISELTEYWDSRRSYLRLCVSFRELDKVSENLLCLKSAVNGKSELMIEQSYLLLCDSLDDVSRLEKIFT